MLQNFLHAYYADFYDALNANVQESFSGLALKESHNYSDQGPARIESEKQENAEDHRNLIVRADAIRGIAITLSNQFIEYF